MGGLYTSDEPLDYEDLYCEECGDSDQLIGYAETREDAWNLFKDDTDIDGSGGWDYDYVQEFINSNWDKQKLNKEFKWILEVKMARFFYELSENGWEYTENIEVEADEKPVCTNDNGEHYLIVNGAKIIFDEEIVEAKQL